jgi:hypothetical protein
LDLADGDLRGELEGNTAGCRFCGLQGEHAVVEVLAPGEGFQLGVIGQVVGSDGVGAGIGVAV